MLLLESFPFFHHQGITEKIFSYAALQKYQRTSNPELPLPSSMLDQRLLPLNKAGTCDSLLFGEGIQVLLFFSLIKKAQSDGVYAMHPLVPAWGRNRLTLNEKKKCCLMAYVILSSSLREDDSQPYGFQRVLITHVGANMDYSTSESNQKGISYLDDAYTKFGDFLQKQGYMTEAQILQIKVLNTRTEFLEYNIQIQSEPWQVLHQQIEIWQNTQRQRSWRPRFWMQGTEFLKWNTQAQFLSLEIWQPHIIQWENTQRQRSWISKFWMQETEFLEWNIQIQLQPWKI